VTLLLPAPFFRAIGLVGGVNRRRMSLRLKTLTGRPGIRDQSNQADTHFHLRLPVGFQLLITSGRSNASTWPSSVFLLFAFRINEGSGYLGLGGPSSSHLETAKMASGDVPVFVEVMSPTEGMLSVQGQRTKST